MSQRDRDARAAMPMLLWCPECGARHVDGGEFATKLHHTHACQECGHVWRPAIEPTCGVRFLPGFKNADAEAPEMPEPAPVRDDERAKVKEACEKARREGRDAGLRDVRAMVVSVSGYFHGDAPMPPILGVMLAAVAESYVPPAPDIASLQAELAKLRAVAEAAAEVAQGRSACLLDALDIAIPGWRSAP